MIITEVCGEICKKNFEKNNIRKSNLS